MTSHWSTRLMGLAALACGGREPLDLGGDAANQTLENIASSWDGTMLDSSFADGSTRLHVTLAADGTGSIEVGDSAAPPAAMDPDAWYPLAPYEHATLVPGFVYPSLGQTVFDGRRVLLEFDTNAIYREWCALQTPVETMEPAGSYGPFACAQDCPEATPTCAVPQQCRYKCACSELGCESRVVDGGELDLFLGPTGDTLEGSFRYGSDREVQFRRQEP